MVGGGLNNEYLSKKMLNSPKCSKSLRKFVQVNIANMTFRSNTCSGGNAGPEYIMPTIKVWTRKIFDDRLHIVAPNVRQYIYG